ncbi:hypothetical protein H6F90_04100 [Trichocoleus sp. FACHB-591]|uniref:hypothetical protein n=1 Tax=Trichocoleus sp. FACHB-591 TaxID=2692872 RepID=UPI00168623F1|nr:hypothetical protein [Trichocoleus sp. FACHB-591]MBD2094331.1 hypothetical protein [Trichocoleus sp. FACHB-591]
MVISDLQYLESVETDSIVGGSRKHKKGKGYGDFKYIQAIQINVALFNKDAVYQTNVIYQG